MQTQIHFAFALPRSSLFVLMTSFLLSVNPLTDSASAALSPWHVQILATSVSNHLSSFVANYKPRLTPSASSDARIHKSQSSQARRPSGVRRTLIPQTTCSSRNPPTVVQCRSREFLGSPMAPLPKQTPSYPNSNNKNSTSYLRHFNPNAKSTCPH